MTILELLGISTKKKAKYILESELSIQELKEKYKKEARVATKKLRDLLEPQKQTA